LALDSFTVFEYCFNIFPPIETQRLHPWVVC